MDVGATVPFTHDVEDLVRVREPGVTAVVLNPAQQPSWLAALAEAVETGRLRVRTRANGSPPARDFGASQTDLNVDLLTAAQSGDEEAWQRLMLLYQPLVNKIIRRHRLSPWDGEDVSQHVWMQLVDQAGRLREPRAVAGWIATTTAHECCRVLRKQKRSVSIDPLDGFGFDSAGSTVLWGSEPERRGVDDNLLRAELHTAVRRGLAELTANQQKLLLLVIADPALPYREISRRMGLPVGSIGPTRARLLKRLENSRDVQLLRNDPPVDTAIAA